MPSVATTIRSAPRRYPAPSAVLEVLKPITWFPPMWAFACGAVSSGVALSTQPLRLAMGIAVAGPLVCAASQAVNDWFDREVDAINEPHRPIPSGRLPGRWGLAVALAWTALSLAAGTLLGTWGFAATVAAVALAWAYSAPPVRLKANGWIGNAAVGFTYEGLAWATGAAVALGGRLPATSILLLAGLYSLGAHGIMTLNDFKSIEGDRRMGVRSLPARHGAPAAARIACVVMIIPQLVVVALLLAWGKPVHAAAVAMLIGVQGWMMTRFVARPVERALWYSGLGVPLFVSGMMVSAFAIRGL